MLNVRLVTTWGTACGIAEHSAQLKAAVEAADSSIEILPDVGALDPWMLLSRTHGPRDPVEGKEPIGDVLHLNYHAALHSRWTPEIVGKLHDRGVKIVLTYHDTIGEISPSALAAQGDTRLDRLADLCPLVDALVVHEPCDGLPIEQYHYWRMGIPAWVQGYQFAERMQQSQWQAGGVDFKAWRAQPVLGTIGFPLPWKNYERLASITRQVGWALLLLAPGATPEQQIRWHEINPHCWVRTGFVPRQEALALLAGCDATAFAYTCGNTGQSGAICQGIAARKPVLALSTCRQFRALVADPLGHEAIRWCTDFEEIAFALRTLSIERCAPGIVALAEQDSWRGLGERYAQLYREVAGG